MNVNGGSLNSAQQKDYSILIKTTGGAEPLYPGVYTCNLKLKIDGQDIQTIKCRIDVPDAGLAFNPANLPLSGV